MVSPRATRYTRVLTVCVHMLTLTALRREARSRIHHSRVRARSRAAVCECATSRSRAVWCELPGWCERRRVGQNARLGGGCSPSNGSPRRRSSPAPFHPRKPALAIACHVPRDASWRPEKGVPSVDGRDERQKHVHPRRRRRVARTQTVVCGIVSNSARHETHDVPRSGYMLVASMSSVRGRWGWDDWGGCGVGGRDGNTLAVKSRQPGPYTPSARRSHIRTRRSRPRRRDVRMCARALRRRTRGEEWTGSGLSAGTGCWTNHMLPQRRSTRLRGRGCMFLRACRTRHLREEGIGRLRWLELLCRFIPHEMENMLVQARAQIHGYVCWNEL
ncbi:hypothetical protein C8Q80DRAFT_210106 [Daedaleopsis nitida]|nr:hypothetical protein C8Q80DRAFT_210106 [Daedaleopsis nitida]